MQLAKNRNKLVLIVTATFGLSLFIVGGSTDSEAQRRRRRAKNKDKVAKRVDRRFDHKLHSEAVTNKLGRDIACAGQCHSMSDDLTGWKLEFDDKKEHERCYRACHNGFKHTYTTRKRKLRGLDGRTCYVCHQELLKYRPRKNNLGRIASKKDMSYAATYSHKKHTRESGTGKQCEACHGAFGDAPPKRKGALAAGHPYCGACHARASEPTMNDCDGCHKELGTKAAEFPVTKPRKASVYAVTGAFTHKSHANAPRVGREGRSCMACHNNVTKGKTDTEVPLPTMQGCYESCHDGKKAFSAIGTKCTECHKGGLQ